MKSSSTVANSDECLRPRPAPGHPGRGVDDDAGRLDQALLHERGQGQRGRRHVAAGGGDEARALAARPGTARAARTPRRPAARAGRASNPYHVGYSEASFSRKAAERSTRQPTFPCSVGARAPCRPRAAGRGRRGRGRRPGRRRRARRPGPGRPRPGWGTASAPLPRPGVSPVAYTSSRSGCWAIEPQQLGARVARRPDDPDADHEA